MRDPRRIHLEVTPKNDVQAPAAARPFGRRAAHSSSGHRFEVWEAERRELERQLDSTPESSEPLLDRGFELEQLIFKTPCLELPAIRIKARRLLWLMEMERADGLAAMRDVYAYLMS
jgi:hypothetical protein